MSREDLLCVDSKKSAVYMVMVTVSNGQRVKRQRTHTGSKERERRTELNCSAVRVNNRHGGKSW